MRWLVESYGREVEIRTKDDGLDLSTLRDDVLMPMLLALGYDGECVRELFFDDEVGMDREMEKEFAALTCVDDSEAGQG
jgi:hypothetical protein